MLLVQDAASLQQALEFISGNELLAYDTETTGLNPRKDKVIGFGVSNGLDGFYVPLWRWDAISSTLLPTEAMVQNLHRIVLSSLANKQLLMFNASFDARFTKYNFGIDLIPALHTDVLLLKHTCAEEFPFGLKEIAAKLWGNDVKKEKEEMQASIKANGGKPSEYFKADVSLLAKYCVQDCLLTYKIYNYYSPKLKRDGLSDFYYTEEVMPLYKQVTIPMEERGVQLDIPKLQNALQCITNDCNALHAQIQEEIKPLIADWTKDFLQKEYPLETAKGNKTKLGKQAEKYGYTDIYRVQMGQFEKDNGHFNVFNLQSKTHLKDLFFDILKEKPLSFTPSGQPQVDEEFLEHVAPKYAWAAQLIEFNKLNKIKSTYIERFLNEQEDGFFYPRFMQHRTISGRFGSDLQQLPRPSGEHNLSGKYSSMVRQFIIPRMAHKLVSADYEQLEPTVFAHTSGDSNLQRIFNSGLDFYSEVAIRTERLSQYSSGKNDENYLGKLAKGVRQRAKAYALGIAYGMTGYKLQYEINVPQDEADKLVRDYLNAFPDLERWTNASKDKAKYDGCVRTQLGRMRRMPKAVELFKKYGERLQDTLRLWKDYNSTPELYAKVKEDRKTYINLLNNAINFQVQGLAASIVNRAMIKIAAEFKAKALDAHIVATVHDEIVVECAESIVAEVSEIMQRVMETNHKLSVPLRAKPIAGDNYALCK